MITFVVPINDNSVYEACFLSSPMLKRGSGHQILEQRRFTNAAAAFNDAIDKSDNDIMVFLHQDVLLPDNWDVRFLRVVEDLEKNGDRVGVVGCVGVTKEYKVRGHVYRHDRELLRGDSFPAEVQTLDEMLVSFRKSTGLRFDTEIPGFFFYGMDICMQSAVMGMKNYAVDVPCFHLPKNYNLKSSIYWQTYKHMMKKWKDHSPIFTNSGPINGYKEYYKRRVEVIKNAVWRVRDPWWKNLPVIDVEKAKHGL